MLRRTLASQFKELDARLTEHQSGWELLAQAQEQLAAQAAALQVLSTAALHTKPHTLH